MRGGSKDSLLNVPSESRQLQQAIGNAERRRARANSPKVNSDAPPWTVGPWSTCKCFEQAALPLCFAVWGLFCFAPTALHSACRGCGRASSSVAEACAGQKCHLVPIPSSWFLCSAGEVSLRALRSARIGPSFDACHLHDLHGITGPFCSEVHTLCPLPAC